jgi:hypothetical protein
MFVFYTTNVIFIFNLLCLHVQYSCTQWLQVFTFYVSWYFSETRSWIFRIPCLKDILFGSSDTVKYESCQIPNWRCVPLVDTTWLTMHWSAHCLLLGKFQKWDTKWGRLSVPPYTTNMLGCTRQERGPFNIFFCFKFPSWRCWRGDSNQVWWGCVR